MRRVTAFSALGEQLSATASAEDAARIIAAVADEYIGWDAYSLVLYDAEHDLIQDILDYDIVNGQRTELPSEPLPHAVGPLTRRTLNEGAQLLLPVAASLSIEGLVPFGDTARPSASLMFVPIRSGQHITGIISVHSYTPDAYTADDLAFLQAVADLCHGALQRIRAESIIRESEQRYRRLVECSPQPTAVVSDGTFVYANAAALRLVGATKPHELVGTGALDVVYYKRQILTKEDGRALLYHIVDAGMVEIQLRRIDGSLVDVELSSIPVTFDEKPAILVVARDITDQKRAERRSATFSMLGQQLSVARTPEAAAIIIANAADALLGWDAYSLVLYDRDEDRMHAILNMDVVGDKRVVVPPGETGYRPGRLSGLVMSEGAQLILREGNDENPLGLTSFGNAERRSASLMFVPIRSGSSFIGILSIQSYTPSMYTDADLQTLQSLADHCGGALERLRAEGASRASEQRFRILFEHAADSIFLVDPHHPGGAWPIVDCNDVACRINGYTREELIGRSIDMVRAEPTDGEADAAFLQDLRTNNMVSFESMNRRRDGTSFPIESSASLVTLGDQELVLEIDRDISERKRVEAALMTAHEAAVEASRLKSEFLATMSHEIRTPMNGVIGMTELLLGTTLDTQQHELATVVRDSAHALLGILNDILDFSKIEAGKLEIVSGDYMPCTMVDNVVDLMRPRAQEQNVVLSSTIALGVPPVVHGDSQRLRQILLNLVSNAVKFTADGSVTLHMDTVRNDRGQPCLHISVSDTGIGISETAQRHVWESFVQADGSTTRKYGGTGLGLAISKRLVELMGGSIAVESTEGVGSTFSITLPYTMPVVKPKLTSDTEAVSCATSGRRHLILIAEDNPVNQKVALMQLQKLGYGAHAVANGMEAVAVVARRFDAADRPYDLILMDCHMPELDGFGATSAIRRFERGRSTEHQDETAQRIDNVPIVAMTANAMRGDREACIAAGMNDYLSKPVRISDLQSVLERWLPPYTATSP